MVTEQLCWNIYTCLCVANISTPLARETAALSTSFSPLVFPAVLMQPIVIPAHSFMQTLSSSLSCLTYLQTPPLPVLLPPPLLSILFLADSFIHKWYIGGYPLSMPDACRLFSDLSLPLAMAQIKYLTLYIFPPTLSLSFPHLVSNIHLICVVS